MRILAPVVLFLLATLPLFAQSEQHASTKRQSPAVLPIGVVEVLLNKLLPPRQSVAHTVPSVPYLEAICSRQHLLG